VLGAGGDREALHRSLAASACVSADGAHATHPNYPDRHEPDHRIAINAGPVLKLNANERYATDATGAAVFQLACDRAGVPLQSFVSRSDLPCGSTIGPVTAGRLGVTTVDVGIPQLAMHSARELCGSTDPALLVAALRAFLS
jgi:aspartyl aminopeptidase